MMIPRQGNDKITKVKKKKNVNVVRKRRQGERRK